MHTASLAVILLLVTLAAAQQKLNYLAPQAEDVTVQ